MFKYTNIFQKKNQQQTEKAAPATPQPPPAPAQDPLPPRGNGFYPGAGQPRPPVQPVVAPAQQKTAAAKPHSGFNLKNLLLIALLIGLGIALAKAGFDYLLPRFMPKPAASQKKTLPIQLPQLPFTAKPAAAPSKTQNASVDLAPAKAEKLTAAGFSVSGIFIADDSAESTAIINNQIVSPGDTVEKATVKEIDMDGVVLEKDGQTIRISNRF